MKILILWAGISLAVYGTMASLYHYYLTTNPRKVFVILDSSHSMQPVWHQVGGILEEIGRRRYTRFTLVTEKSRYQTWVEQIDATQIKPYAPRDFSKLLQLYGKDIDRADEVYLISNAIDKALPKGRWTHISPAE